MGDHTGQQPGVCRVTPETRLAAAGRLVERQGLNPAEAGAKFLARAADHGIDLDLFWSIPGGPGARQAALIVPQPGRTAMIFLSGVGQSRRCGDRRRQHADRVAVLRTAFDEAARLLKDRLHLIQALPDPQEWWATEAFASAGMTRLGDLAYLKRTLSGPSLHDDSTAAWPPGVEVKPVRGLADDLDGPALREALERTYVDTLDCPGLCDLRETVDVIESHRSTGRFDPSLWWIIRHEDRPEGCVLLSPNPEQDSIELVYMGLGPRLRGRGLGAKLLTTAIARARRCRLSEINCAVDIRNEPARSTYAKLGFSEFARRIAFVQSTRVAPASP